MKKENKIAVIGLSGESIFMKVDHFHQEGETVVADIFHKEYGGKGYNQAVAAKRFGADVSFLTLVGDDQIADEVERTLNEEHIRTMCIRRKNSQSAYACIIIDKDGNNRVTCYPGVSAQMTREEILMFESEIASSKYLLLQLEMSDESLLEAIRLAKKYQTKIILNPAPAHKLSNDILNSCDILTPNEHEAEILFNIRKNYINQVLTINHPCLIITLGKNGSILKNYEVVKYIKPLEVNTLNSTGAGDTYNGVLTACLLEGYRLEKAVEIASVAASISVTKEFVIDSIPYKEEILNKYETIYKKNNVKLEEDN